MRFSRFLFAAFLVSFGCAVALAQIVISGGISVSGGIAINASASGGTNVGCGVGAGGTLANLYDQSTCGNYSGAPYEDLATASSTTAPSPTGSGSLTTIPAGSCPATLVPNAAGAVFRLAGNVSDGAGGTNQNCLHFAGQTANNFVIDLAGYTLTGGIKCDQSLGGNDCSGITIVNGIVNCNIANGGSEGCIYFNNSGNPSKSILLSHLTVSNSNSPSNPDSGYSGFEFAILMVANGSTPQGTVAAGSNQKTFNGAGVELAHLTVTNAAGYSGSGYSGQWCARCTSIQVDSAGGTTVEAWNNYLAIPSGYVDANQGLLCYATSTCLMHNNYAPWVAYQGTADTGRPFMFDAAGKTFDQSGGAVFNNYVVAYNNRCVRTRQVNNVLVHDNLFTNIQSTTVDPCIMEGGNGDYAEKINGNQVYSNTFEVAGGTVIEAAESYGLTANQNTFTCQSNCSTAILGASWLQEGGGQGLNFSINSASRTSGCVVTLTLANGPASTSVLNGQVYVNVSGRSDDFNVAGTAANLVTTVSGSTVTYTQAGCAGANSGTSGGIFWMAQNSTDNYPANGAQLYIKNSIVDPAFTSTDLFAACGQTGHSLACGNPPQSNQAAIEWCNNTQNGSNVAAVGGTGATVTHLTPDNACP